jgi:hypothetical protein
MNFTTIASELVGARVKLSLDVCSRGCEKMYNFALRKVIYVNGKEIFAPDAIVFDEYHAKNLLLLNESLKIRDRTFSAPVARELFGFVVFNPNTTTVGICRKTDIDFGYVCFLHISEWLKLVKILPEFLNLMERAYD